MQIKQKKNMDMTELNSSLFTFNEPTKPKLSSRIFVSSAKINLNRYWDKLERLISDIKIVKKNKKKLRNKSANHQLQNNYIHPVMNQQEAQAVATNNDDEVYGFTTAKFPTCNNTTSLSTTTTTATVESTICKSAYKPFIDDEFYNGVNLNLAIPILMSTSLKLPSDSPIVIDKTSSNYNYYLNESRRSNSKSHRHNDNTYYIQQLNKSLKSKGFKVNLAEYQIREHFLEHEGYLV